MSYAVKTCDTLKPAVKAYKFANGRGLCAILVICLLGGCAAPQIPLNTLRYEQKTSVTSNKNASVVVVTGDVRGDPARLYVPAGNIFVPMYSAEPYLGAMFNSDDQQAFGEALRSELVRLGVLKTASAVTSATTDLKIQVTFVRTHHRPGIQVYTLDVDVNLTGGREPSLHQYHIISNEKDTLWEKMNTGLPEAKVKAVYLLMEKLIPDIEQYVASM